MPTESRIVTFHGNVQGVGFRWTTRNIAASYDITGYVRNLPDGTVEVYAEGEPREVESFLSELRSEMSAHIRKSDTQKGPGHGGYSSFIIRH